MVPAELAPDLDTNPKMDPDSFQASDSAATTRLGAPATDECLDSEWTRVKHRGRSRSAERPSSPPTVRPIPQFNAFAELSNDYDDTDDNLPVGAVLLGPTSADDANPNAADKSSRGHSSEADAAAESTS